MSQLEIEFAKARDTENILNTFCKFEVNFSKIHHKHELCSVHCNDEHDTDILFGESCSLVF